MNIVILYNCELTYCKFNCIILFIIYYGSGPLGGIIIYDKFWMIKIHYITIFIIYYGSRPLGGIIIDDKF